MPRMSVPRASSLPPSHMLPAASLCLAVSPSCHCTNHTHSLPFVSEPPSLPSHSSLCPPPPCFLPPPLSLTPNTALFHPQPLLLPSSAHSGSSGRTDGDIPPLPPPPYFLPLAPAAGTAISPTPAASSLPTTATSSSSHAGTFCETCGLRGPEHECTLRRAGGKALPLARGEGSAREEEGTWREGERGDKEATECEREEKEGRCREGERGEEMMRRPAETAGGMQLFPKTAGGESGGESAAASVRAHGTLCAAGNSHSEEKKSRSAQPAVLSLARLTSTVRFRAILGLETLCLLSESLLDSPPDQSTRSGHSTLPFNELVRRPLSRSLADPPPLGALARADPVPRASFSHEPAALLDLRADVDASTGANSIRLSDLGDIMLMAPGDRHGDVGVLCAICATCMSSHALSIASCDSIAR
ncbi:unnamed protein product [Closterium sp. NIES-54]